MSMGLSDTPPRDARREPGGYTPLPAAPTEPDSFRPPSPESVAGPLHADVGVLALLVDQYGSRWTSRHQILTRLARYFHVTWLNPAPEWRRAFQHPRLRAREGTVPGQPSSFIVREAALHQSVFHHPGWLARATTRARLRAARASLVDRGCRKVVLYIWHSRFAPALDIVPHDLSVYHVYDEYSHAEVEQPIDPGEERLLRGVGQLITLSPTMFARKGVLNPHSVRIPNGVEYEAFAAPGPEPADLARIPRPRLGYAGFIKKQLDLELLHTLATRHPEWSFVFVGARRPHPEAAPVLERLSALPNVHLLGGKRSTELARYPQHFDVCLMPYRRNDYTKYISPLKLFEYLAGGRPVVSVPLPALVDAPGLVMVASGVNEWEAALARALGPEANAAHLRAARQAAARAHDWSGIARLIAELVTARLAEVEHAS
ncbi:MAG TPA: glycosyltransferase [Gemmatimonadaceae bacterium]